MATSNPKASAKADAKVEDKAATLKALTRIEHDGEVYEAGAELPAMAAKAAGALIECGAAAEANATAEEAEA